jgi:hypothetical protein
MKRLYTGWILAAIALPVVGRCQTDEIFPVIHNEPIAVQVLDGRTGNPQPDTRVVLIAGYDRRDLALGQWREELLTDASGKVHLSNELRNLPFLRIEVLQRHACDRSADQAAFSIERIRIDGFSGANHCGMAVLADTPGVIAFFIKGRKMPKEVGRLTVQANEPTARPAAGVEAHSEAGQRIRPVADEPAVLFAMKTPTAKEEKPREARSVGQMAPDSDSPAIPWFVGIQTMTDLGDKPPIWPVESRVIQRRAAARVAKRSYECKAPPTAPAKESAARTANQAADHGTHPSAKPETTPKPAATAGEKQKGATGVPLPVAAKPAGGHTALPTPS